MARHQEELAERGFTVLEGVLSADELAEWRERIDAVYAHQETEFGGREALASIQEQDVCRAPLLYDHRFLSLVTEKGVLSLIRRVLGDWFILNLQNAIINRPEQRHHQSAWHRDLPYQNWTSSRPLAVGALFAIDPFTKESGGTVLLPHSHRSEAMPSEDYFQRHAVQAVASAGSVLVFDAMVFHRAGQNQSDFVRRGINHLYTIPLFKQQYDFPTALGDALDIDSATRRMLGYDSRVPHSALEWRRKRAARLHG